uniref:NADH-ubiquinone oxidoreductase chain 2 n=1 Tax=Volvariella volvacea TaxID=36659 RepID=A0A5H2Q7W1_9AGAR|nr:NADH dehydrogenase subunit 2 [Volvariella volvacea]AYD91362.1 NADH dehydrogenase subunit 2 [Volvariella volvacea]AYD91393.1 NADH dehydrogenase subunit 2 [Volvariella volvacea]AYD91445.1 NADH dehydrogenase subunit 2 [Volvariella volvacea]
MIFISILTLIVAKALPSFNSNLSPIYFTRISAIIFLYAGALSFNALYIQSIGSGIGIYSGLFHVTQISALIETFLLIIGSLILIAWPLIQKNYKTYINYCTDYSLIVLFSTLGATLLISSSDLVSMYLSIELQSFGLYVLSTLYRDSESSTSAGLKYFLLGGLSSCLILLGAGLIYAFTGLTNFESIYSLISVSEVNYIIQGLSLGLVIIIVGFLFKIAAAPLHNWSPDVYDDTPTIVTIWLTIMPKISILILLLELITQIGFIGGLTSLTISSSGYVELFGLAANINLDLSNLSYISALNIIGTDNSINLLKNLLLISSILSLIIGTVVGLAQTKIKRLLAYSTISHIGFILLALAINTEQSIDSLIFYIIQYSITNLNIFLIIIALSYVINNQKIKDLNIKDIRFIAELKGQFFSNPILSLSLAICLFSMAGIPPLIGFFSKQFVLYSAVQSGYNFIALVAILVSVVSASYYLKIVKVLYTENTVEETTNTEALPSVQEGVASSATILTNFHSFLISTLTLSILFFILKPSLILNSTQLLSLSLFNF